MDCETAREHLDAWALGALDSHELRALESHLSSCESCAALADEARESAARVAMAVPLRSSSAALKARMMHAARVLGARPASVRRWRVLTAAAAVVAIAALGWGTMMQLRAGDARDERDELASSATAQASELVTLRTEVTGVSASRDDLVETIATQNEVLDIAFRPDVVWIELSGTPVAPSAKGRCVWSKGESLGAFISENLPPPEPGSHYEIWLIYEDNKWVSGGRFEVDRDGRGRLIMQRFWGTTMHGTLRGIAVSVEDDEAPAAPSQQLVMHSVVR
jgi:predicted nicotinamide N-methyase